MSRRCGALCGARAGADGPERHDQVFAAVSHLPHALAFALVSMIAARPDAPELFSFAGAGFRDFTRIAGSSPEMWRDICLANRDAIAAEIEAFQSELAALAECIRAAMREAVRTRLRGGAGSPQPLAAAVLAPAMVGYPPFLDLPPLAGARGSVQLPGSKSISNRTLLLAALAQGVTEIHDLLASDDVDRMLEALEHARCARRAAAPRRRCCGCTGAAAISGQARRAVPRQRRHGVAPAHRGAGFVRRALPAVAVCRACTSARSAIWWTHCASSAPRSATSVARAFRRWRSCLPRIDVHAARSACAARSPASS